MNAYSATLVDSDQHDDSQPVYRHRNANLHDGEMQAILQSAETSLSLLLDRCSDKDLYIDRDWIHRIRGPAERVAQRARGRG